MTKLSIRRVLLGTACSFALSAPAFAQDDAAAEDDANTIIVTAQNRAQDVTDVPIVIDVVNAEELRKSGFASMNDIDKIAPVVQVNQDQGTVKVTVRGVGTNDGGEAQDTSVVVSIDGEYLNRPNIMGMAMFDMERVEVLRGPQGTLYGRNSTGGAINFITRKPGRDFGVNATASYGNYNAIRADAGIDVPLGEIGGLRFAGFYENRDGYVKYPAGGGFAFFPAFAAGRTDDMDAYGGRASLRLEPNDALTVDLSGEYSRRQYIPATFAFVNFNAGGNGPTGPGCNAPGFVQVGNTFPETVNVAGVPTVLQRTLCFPANTNHLPNINRANYATPGFGVGHLGDDTWALRTRIAYEFSDEATLTYTGGYRSYSGDPDNKVTLPFVYQSFTFQDEARTHSHELRLNGEVGNVVYQLGGFYFKEKLNREPAFFIRPINPPPPLCTAPPNGPFCGQNGSFLTYFGRYITSESKSLFGQVEVPLGETLTAIGGLRYTDNKRDALYLNATPFGNPALWGTGPGRKDINAINAVRLTLGNSEDKITWLLGLNYKPNSDTLVYAKASTGFKGGGFDAVGDYKPETNMAFEAGWKQAFGQSGQHQFNFSGFHYDYKDLQVSVLLDTAVGGQVFNAGKATIWGLEADATIALDDNTTFNMSVNYLNSEYKELLATFNVFCINNVPATIPANTCGINGVGDIDPVTPGVQQPNFAGNRTPFAPRFIVALGLEHVFDLGSSGTITVGTDTLFKSQYFTSFYNHRDGSQKAFAQSGANLTYKPENEQFTIAAFVRNIQNVRPLTYGNFISAGADDIFNWQFGTPRTYGLRVSVDF